MGTSSPRRSVKDRLEIISPPTSKPHITPHAAKRMLLRGFENSKAMRCTIDRHYRTRVFGFPGTEVIESVPCHTIYESKSVQASLVCDLKKYFEDSQGEHYKISPPLRHEVAQERKKLNAHRNGIFLFVVIEEANRLAPVLLDPECALLDEVVYEDGKRTPLLKGGRDNQKFIAAFKTSDGKWPAIPSNEQTINMILAAVRAAQDARGEVPNHIDASCLVTDDGRFVSIMPELLVSARLSVTSQLEAPMIQTKAAEIRGAISRMERDLGSEHIELLVSALYWDDFKDDDFRRLHYLRLWQSLAECSKKLGYIQHPKTKLHNDQSVLAGKRSLAELTDYRNRIAHWWSGSMDESFLGDIYCTLNELGRVNAMRRRSVESVTAPIKARGATFGVPNERRATPSGVVTGSTLRAGPVFPPGGVAARLCAPATRRSRRLASQENRPGRAASHSVNTP